MAPYALYIRDDSSSSNSTDSSSSSDASSSDSSSSSFMDAHGKQVYIALAVIGVLLLLIFIWAFCTHRLSFIPFNQKRCSKCGHGILKSSKLDDDYFTDDDDNGKKGGYLCRKCQEEKEDEELEEELESEGLGKRGPKKRDNAGTGYAGGGTRKKSKKMKEWEDEDGDHEDYSDEEKQMGTQIERKPTRAKRDDIPSDRSPTGKGEKVGRTGARTAKDDSGRNGNIRSTRRQEEERRPSRQRGKEEQRKSPARKKREESDDDDYSD
ncbi:hypothetical protein C366_04875 [Cryptococcus neoformans Tu401-1]|nr:hypothetical protein C366_04875 [Cryptococcus neoformans var. grubii Tu401-1]